MKLIDVTVPLDAKVPTCLGNTPFTIEPGKRIAEGRSPNVSSLHLRAHAGTDVDAPRHFHDAGGRTDALPFERRGGRARAIEVTAGNEHLPLSTESDGAPAPVVLKRS
jgi:kynurenine formamidase